MHSPVARSQSLTFSSRLPDASVLPSGLIATENTELVWPTSVLLILPVATSQSRILPSEYEELGGATAGLGSEGGPRSAASTPPDTSILPFGVKANVQA